MPIQATAADLQLAAYDYTLPPDRIAQNPVTPRDRSRLLAVIDQTQHQHHHFFELPQLLKPGDLLVLNDTRVIPARLHGVKPSGVAIEVLLLEDQGENRWLALVKPGRRLKPGAEIQFHDPQTGSVTPLLATVLATDAATGGRVLQFSVPEGTKLWDWIEKLGQVPLPPYITDSQAEAEQYQTVYSREAGAVAAPTAGLHFTPKVFEQLQTQGIQSVTVTLHVGIGTFRPVEVEQIQDHVMHQEWVEINQAAVEQIQQTQAKGGRIIAVGTTVVRTLEGVARHLGSLQPFRGKVNLFIYPGYEWQVVAGLITNFHLPRSSLMMLVSALIGRDRLLNLYQIAIAEQYRFYSFGDAMVILPTAKV